MRAIFLFVVLNVSFGNILLWAQSADGVYVSSTRNQQSALREKQSSIEKFVNAVEVKCLISNVERIFQQLNNQQETKLMPQFATMAMYQVVMQAMQENGTQEILRNVDSKVVDFVMAQLKQGVAQSDIENKVVHEVEVGLSPVYKSPAFQSIVIQIVEASMKEQHRVLSLELAQRQAQMAAMVQRQQMVQTMVQNQIRQSVTAGHSVAVPQSVPSSQPTQSEHPEYQSESPFASAGPFHK